MPTTEDTVVPPSATEKDCAPKDVRQEKIPVTDHLHDFPLVLDRVCVLLLAALAVFVPALTGRRAQGSLGTIRGIISGSIIGVTCTLPTTMCISKANGSAHTKWYWGEMLTILGSSIPFIFIMNAASYEASGMRMLAYFVFAVSIAFPCMRAMCRRDRAPGDRKRATLLLLTGSCQVMTYIGELSSEFVSPDVRSVRNTSLWSIGVVASAAFVVMLFWMDRNKKIEHSVPYAVAYAWALSASVLGASYILGLFYRFDTLINSVFGQYSKSVSQVALTLFSTIVVWVFEQVSRRITTARSHTTFMFPGLFAVVDCKNTHTKIRTQTYTRAHTHTNTHTYTHTHTHTHTHT
jgi:hypothetical protein